ncbi:MAG: ferritin [Candidatus Odinarchaeia archaeon]
MQLDKEMENALNEQIKNEFESAYIYLSMSTWLKEHNFNNLANWYFIQTKEEVLHALKFVKFIVDAGGRVEYKDIKQLKKDWDSVEEIVKAGLKHERFITGKIYELVELAEKLKQYQVKPLLTWFVDEQLEEEANAMELVEKQKAFDNDMLFDAHVTRADISSESGSEE